jgi:prepilin peptidase CpaA
MSVSNYLDLLLMTLVLVAAANDLATRRIPNHLLMIGATGALMLHLFGAAPAAQLWSGLGGAVTGLLLFLPLYCLRGMAAGDVKLLATVGFFCSPGEIMQIALWSVCAGGVMALLVVIVNGRLLAALVNVRSLLRPLLMRMAGIAAVAEPMPAPSVGSIPYGLAIATGTLLVMAGRYHCY